MAKMTTPVGTLSFPTLFKPRAFKGEPEEKAEYSCVLIFDEKAQQTDAFRAMRAAAIEAGKAEFGNDFNIDKLNDRGAPFKDSSKSDYAGYDDGCVHIRAKRKRDKGKPGVIDRNKNDILDAGAVYPGMKARAIVSCYAYDYMGKGIAWGLEHVQVAGDGPRLDGSKPADQSFEDDLDASYMEAEDSLV